MTDQMEQIASRLLSARNQAGSVYLYPHIGVDGDALGASLALLLVLRRAGLPVRLFLDEPVPDRLVFLPALDLIEPYDETRLAELAVGQQLALAIDCSEATRVGLRQALFDQAPQTAVIDHHVSGGESGYLRWIDASAAAVGEMVFDLVSHLGALSGQNLVSPEVATLLMTAIISDTGGFVYSNTSARTFQTAASLMAYQINLRQITYQLFDLTSQARMRLMGRVFSSATFSHQGRLVLAQVDQRLLDECGATDNDLDGVIAHLRNVAGVEVAFLIREMKDGALRVNIRSNEHFNAAEFARGFGGGGHPKAAGLQMRDLALDEAARKILDKAGEWL
jgi:bifunctional oligoribonuclease and PAP phosphatase NrnA